MAAVDEQQQHMQTGGSTGTAAVDTAPWHVQLLPPPVEYTRLHAQVQRMHRAAVQKQQLQAVARQLLLKEVTAAAAFPAICLVCGAVLDAGGLGQCTAHSSMMMMMTSSMSSPPTDEAANSSGIMRSMCCASETGVFFLLHVSGQTMHVLLHYIALYCIVSLLRRTKEITLGRPDRSDLSIGLPSIIIISIP